MLHLIDRKPRREKSGKFLLPAVTRNRSAAGTLIVAFAFLASSAGAEVLLQGSGVAEHGDFYTGRLEKIANTSLFEFHPDNPLVPFPPNGLPLRLWGIKQVSNTMSLSLVSGSWRCKPVRPLEVVVASGFATAICDRSGKMLSAGLVSAGAAIEDCAETKNHFGTCEVRELEQ
ncbi:MAG: hypothetical protein ACT4OK_04120 [Gemmobacter sp.]